MNSAILAAAARLISPVIFVVSLILLYRGHNLPGGGFIGGLTAATAILLRDFSREVVESIGERPAQPPQTGEKRPMPVRLMVMGMALAGASAFIPVLLGQPFFTGLWMPGFSLPILGKIHLGTPLVFDVGVYLAVIGFVVHSARCLAEDEESDLDREKEGG